MPQENLRSRSLCLSGPEQVRPHPSLSQKAPHGRQSRTGLQARWWDGRRHSGAKSENRPRLLLRNASHVLTRGPAFGHSDATGQLAADLPRHPLRAPHS